MSTLQDLPFSRCVPQHSALAQCDRYMGWISVTEAQVKDGACRGSQGHIGVWMLPSLRDTWSKGDVAKLSVPFLFIALPQSHSYSREALLSHGKHKELGFGCPSQTLQQAQIYIHLLNPTPASHPRLPQWYRVCTSGAGKADGAEV